MSEARAEFNPFQPPVSQAADAPNVRLGDDDAFLVLRKQILCRDPVELPKVCVFYGETEDLEPRRTTLRTLRPLSGFVVFLLIISVFVVPGILMDSAGSSATSSWMFALKFVVYLLFLLGGIAIVWKKGCYRVDVTWYLCKRYRRRAAIERRIAQVIVVAGAVGLVLCLPLVEFLFQVLFLAVIVAMLVGLRLNCEEKLQLSGKRGDAYVLLGHRKRFFEEVTRQRSNF